MHTVRRALVTLGVRVPGARAAPQMTSTKSIPFSGEWNDRICAFLVGFGHKGTGDEEARCSTCFAVLVCFFLTFLCELSFPDMCT